MYTVVYYQNLEKAAAIYLCQEGGSEDKMTQLIDQIKSEGKKALKAFLPPVFRGKISEMPAVGEINFGDFARLTPISTDWGLKRGGSIDRYYIENFLEKYAGDIKGRALEILNDNYLKRFGGALVKHRDILDVDASNPQATVIADLAKAYHLPADTYDCFVLTQTLQLIYDLRSAIKHIYRILKPGGVLLVTVPGISHFPRKTAPRHWSFTEYSLKTLLEEQFPKEKIKIETHGNVLVAASFLYGIGAGELKKEMYDHNDPNYQLIITAKAVK